MQVRGLKLCRFSVGTIRHLVAPHAGAWIETFCFVDSFAQVRVAPHAGAWIETFLFV